jgi:ATP-binding cassette subfamily C (CFTR/MRP) protein 10
LPVAKCIQIRAFSFASGGLLAAQRLHERLLSAVCCAPCALFASTPSGRILNRFSSDVATADDSLPFILNILLAVLFSMLGVLAVLIYSLPLLAVAFVPLALVYRWLQVGCHPGLSTVRTPPRVFMFSTGPAFAPGVGAHT